MIQLKKIHQMILRSVVQLSVTVALVLVASMASAQSRPAVQASPAQAGEFPNNWYFPNAIPRTTTRGLEGKLAPELQLSDWIGEPQDLKKLRGRVVVLDFWGTWCGPCMRAIPENVKLMDRYSDLGLTIIGVHDSKRGRGKMPAVAEAMKINYPLAVDINSFSERLWKVRFWPTYVVIDRKGIVRAAGLQPGKVEMVVRALIAEKVVAENQESRQPTEPGGIPRQWLEGRPRDLKRYTQLLELDAPPVLDVADWINSEPMILADLKGKVVVLDFWWTKCSRCRQLAQHTNSLYEKYRDDGLVIIGVCARKDIELMTDTVKSWGITIPVCADTEGKTTEAYKVNGYPDFHLIDRSGKLRIADCRNGNVEDAIKFLLAEDFDDESSEDVFGSGGGTDQQGQ